MGNDLICVNATFTPKQLEFWKLHGVVHPELNKIYSLRSVTRHTNSSVGIRLNEIVNPKIKVRHSILSEVYLEPTWRVHRFKKLNGEIITEKELKEENILIK